MQTLKNQERIEMLCLLKVYYLHNSGQYAIVMWWEESDKHINIQNQLLDERLRNIDFVCVHFMHNQQHKVDVEDEVNVNYIKHHHNFKKIALWLVKDRESRERVSER